MNQIVKSNNISCPHGFSTRLGGVSKGIYDSLNLGMNRGDDPKLVTTNWDIFLRNCSIDSENLYAPNMIPFVCGAQVHGNTVHIASREDARIAYGKCSKLIEADGYVTNKPNLPLAIFTADCTPLLMEDPVNKVIAAVHCGWRSTALDIMKNAVDAMILLGSNVTNIRAAIGPAICYNCFEVGYEVIDAMKKLLNFDPKEYYRINPNNQDKYYLDLKAVVKARLLQLNLSENNIDDVNECTMCHPDKYWSHRITGLNRGSQANVIMLKDN